MTSPSTTVKVSKDTLEKLRKWAKEYGRYGDNLDKLISRLVDNDIAERKRRETV